MVMQAPESWGSLKGSSFVTVPNFLSKKKKYKVFREENDFYKNLHSQGEGDERRLRHLHVRTEYLSPGTIKNLDLQNLCALKRSGS